MPVLASVKVFAIGRHCVAMTTLTADGDEERIVAIRVRVDDKLIGTVAGDRYFEDETAMEKAVLLYISSRGVALKDR